MNPQGRVVIITGASSGIGAAAAQAFAQAGAKLVLAARSQPALSELAARLPQPPLVVPTDVSDQAQCQALIAQAKAHYGHIDILINNAGVGLAGPIATLNPADLERAFAVDLFGPLYLIQAAVPLMRQQGRGQIINVSSVLAAQTLPYIGGYAATKAAFERMSQALRMELLGSGIKVSVLRPGTTRTAFSQSRLGSGQEQRRIAPRGVSPEVVAQALVRVAKKEPRQAYVTLNDRLALLASSLAPGLVERILSRTIRWREKTPG